MSTASERIDKFVEENPDPQDCLGYMETIAEMAREDGLPVDCDVYYSNAQGYIGMSHFYGWDGNEIDYRAAFPYLDVAYRHGNRNILYELGCCYENGSARSDGQQDHETAFELWKEGAALGDPDCTIHYCGCLLDEDKMTEKELAMLEDLVNAEEPCADAAAILYQYYWWEGDEDTAWMWRDKAIEMGSELIESLIEDEKEDEVGEDDWTESDDDDDDDDDYEDEFDGYDDETEGAVSWNPEIGEKYVIVALTNDSFRIVQADASDWDSLPAIIGADRCENMRCEVFRKVSRKLALPGTLLGNLDREAFRKPRLKPNWHASQWYDGMADLMGNMIICMEDDLYRPFSFSSRDEAQRVIDALLS